MLRTGLVSVTFRKLSPREIVELAAQACLEGIEWGGDVHVPPGDVALARQVGAMTRDAGLGVAAYGSYYRVGREERMPIEFVLETARELGAPTCRVWAGDRGSDKSTPEHRQTLVRQTRRVADWAADLGIVLAFEYHANTLTDTGESARQLLEEVGHPNVTTYWQTPAKLPFEQCLQGLEGVLRWLRNVHVFHWDASRARRPLAEGRQDWHGYLPRIRSTGRDHWLLLEFVREDSSQAFLDDAATLRQWVSAS